MAGEFRPILSQSRSVLEPKNFLSGTLPPSTPDGGGGGSEHPPIPPRHLSSVGLTCPHFPRCFHWFYLLLGSCLKTEQRSHLETLWYIMWSYFKICQNPWKKAVNEFLLSKVAGLQLAILLKYCLTLKSSFFSNAPVDCFYFVLYVTDHPVPNLFDFFGFGDNKRLKKWQVRDKRIA